MKFIHVADVHLGAVPNRDAPWSKERSSEIWDSFRNVIKTAKEQDVDLLLIAGDLFHRQPLLRELKEVNYLFASIPDTKVVLIAGNHDYLKRDAAYRDFPWAPNVYGLWGQQLESVYLEDIDVYVYGLSYHSREITDRLYDEMRPVRSSTGIHILLAHGGDESHIPIDKRILGAAGFDYVALGHIHKPQILIPDKMAYAGALEPLEKNETGRHGYIMGTCDAAGTRISFVSCASRFYIPLVMQIQSDTTQFQIEEMITEEMKKLGRQNIYQIILEGFRSVDSVFDAERLKAIGNVTDVTDDTRPAYDFESIATEYKGSLIGEFVEHFMKKDLTIVESRALEYGLTALLEAKE